MLINSSHIHRSYSPFNSFITGQQLPLYPYLPLERKLIEVDQDLTEYKSACLSLFCCVSNKTYLTVATGQKKTI